MNYLTKKNRIDHKRISLTFFDKDESTYICKECKTPFSITNSHLSNLTTHLITVHKYDCSHIIKMDYNKGKIKKSKVEGNLGIFNKFFSGSTVPLNIVNTQSFKELVLDLNPNIQIPSSYYIQKTLADTSIKYIELAKDRIKSCQALNLCLDIWSYKRDLVVASNAKLLLHNGDFCILFLNIRIINNQKSSEISQYIAETINNYNIPINKLLTITTDNCHSMLRAAKDYTKQLSDNFEYKPLAQEDNIANEKIIINLPIEINDRSPSKHELTHRIKILLFESVPFIHTGCIIHKLQLVLKGAVEEFPQVDKLLEDMKKNIKFLKRLSNRDHQIYCPSIGETRWNSIYIVLDSFLKKQKTYEKINEIKTQEFYFTTKEFLLLRYIRTILFKFFQLTKILESDGASIIQFFYPYLQLKQKLVNSLDKEVPKLIIDLTKSILEKMNHYVCKAVNQWDPLTQIIKFLSPILFTNMGRKEIHTIREKIMKIFNETLDLFFEEELNPVASKVKIDPDTFLDSDCVCSSPTKDSIPNQETSLNEIVKAELRRYEKSAKNSNLDMVNYWELKKEKYPYLNLLYKTICCFGISNGSIERLFSLCKTYKHWKRNKLSIKSMNERILSNKYFELQ